MGSPNVSKILVIGATGYIGRHLIQASIKLGHPTFALARPITSSHNIEKINLIQSFKNNGVNVLFGELNDHDWLMNMIKKLDIVFLVLGHEPSIQLEEQTRIISAIKEAGNIKRYFPSEFGFDVHRLQILEPAKRVLAIKVKIREAIRKEGIPFTFVSSNFCCSYFLSRLGQIEATGIPTDTVFVLGDGNTKECPQPFPFFYAIAHAGFIKGETTKFDIDPTVGVEASQLYPDVKYTTVENFMDQFL
ncbi:isoflavone reductase-like protein [Dendrobium catenatum]|uniref:isoflavone reductase-like protein n=1 Tax=Dendrobium catenatum TaxID=906689 RepID=UPI0010A08763|nr:isoflavone reductase-like protein [Dendrobium catenatum]